MYHLTPGTPPKARAKGQAFYNTHVSITSLSLRNGSIEGRYTLDLLILIALQARDAESFCSLISQSTASSCSTGFRAFFRLVL